MRLMTTQESTKSVPSNGMTKGFSQGCLNQVKKCYYTTQDYGIWLVQDKLGVEGQQRRAQTKLHRLWLPTHMCALHAYACYSTATTPLLHSSLTHPRICVAFYAYAYHLIHHPVQPPFYTNAILPTHMRALHAYACPPRICVLP
ncbi:hypothetical protein PIB30_100413 [Stylosanthes scabra]|uniref:Uncharacterized protein n=1 Tax=Stylosanthes scabra TaxID=79078 RepID=A0ABU6SYP2_9FABA|nr:hypothetical protein [Stylosanthes scabra]